MGRVDIEAEYGFGVKPQKPEYVATAGGYRHHGISRPYLQNPVVAIRVFPILSEYKFRELYLILIFFHELFVLGLARFRSHYRKGPG